MGKIICLFGKSNSGKDTIFKELRGDENLKLKPIVTYTTRPKRDTERDGTEYYFIDESKLETYDNMGKVIEKRSYNTVNGKWHYATVDDGQFDSDNENYILITTLEAYKNIKAYFGEEKIIPFYINVEDGIRLERALKRERNQHKPNYEEMCRRFLADNEDFSGERLKECGIKKYYNNYSLEDCLNQIKNDIINNI
ncbi:nucleoside/nucleotide kinase family protein [Clostridium felsineum]|uniref:Guanylate kinase n=1 Tax=Clostridium felsineum TaxID=36839 RepID=A0A1S8LJK9_9CLOT|nr:guanylate kinase [Clostridium felsineum]URZ04838.1 Guanylate kinase [Clostridium felsineum]URZ09879.1 Guanylate kinase [Clostridium felsineum]